MIPRKVDLNLEPGFKKPRSCICSDEESENFAISKLLTHYYVPVSRPAEELTKLCCLLDSLGYRQVVIYMRNPFRCDVLANFLNAHGYKTTSVHPNVPRKLRLKRYNNFVLGGPAYNTVLVTSSCGHALGISENVDIVINFDESPDSWTYCHRISSRLSRKGLVLNFARKKKSMKILNKAAKAQNFVVQQMPQVILASTYLPL